MLEQLSDRIRMCDERAVDASERADASCDPALKAEFLNTERGWLKLACSMDSPKALNISTH
jgi:hypothetical protein